MLALCALANTSWAGVLMQGFYWNVPPGGTWYDTLKARAPELKAAGFTAIWFPPPSKGASGGYSVGYDPYDFYDLGQYDQMGSTETRYGSAAELKAAVAAYRALGMDVYVDLVVNHSAGGATEDNPLLKSRTQTLFNVRSGRFNRTWRDFTPNGEYCTPAPDFCGSWGRRLCLDHDYVKQNLIAWARWLVREVGFSGFRFDAGKCMHPAWLKWFRGQVDPSLFAVVEYWDGDKWALNRYADQSGTAVFDFPLRYALKDMANNTSGTFDMARLASAGFNSVNPFQAVTFVENHDTDKQSNIGDDPVITDKMLAYAYILTAEGYPTVFWRDYYDYRLKGQIDPLLWVHEHLAMGRTTIIHADGDLYVARRGDGLIVMINDSPSQARNAGMFATPWPNVTIKDYSGHIKDLVRTDAKGMPIDYTLWAPRRSYAVWAPAQETP